MKHLFAIISFAIVLGCSSDQDSCEVLELKDVACIEIYAPVCGCNNRTYSTAVKQSLGADDYSEGQCGNTRGSGY